MSALKPTVAELVGTKLGRPETRRAATRCVLDWLGCALGGVGQPAAALAREALEPAPDGRCRVLGSANRWSARDAAFANGTAGHALDYDDENAAMCGHPGATIVPATLAVAELIDASGDELLDAVAVGYEVAAWLGRSVNPGHYGQGWHATATLGTIAAAAAAAHLLRLDSDGVERAVAIAATQAGGIRSVFGTPAKAAQVGAAASNAVVAARLAAAGLSPSDSTLDAYLSMVAPDYRWRSGLGDDHPAVLDTTFKVHAACGGAHCLIEATAQAARDNRVRPDRIEAVRGYVGNLSLDMAKIRDPQTALEKQFCLAHLAAAAVLTYPITVAALEHDHPGLHDLRQRVSVTADPAFTDNENLPARVEIELRDRQLVTAQVDHARGSSRRPLADGEIEEKFMAMAVSAIGETSARELARAVWRLGREGSVREVMARAGR